MNILVQKGTIIEHAPVSVAGVSYVAVFDEQENTPLLIIEQVGHEVVHITHANEPEFKLILRRLGMLGAVPAPEEMVVKL